MGRLTNQTYILVAIFMMLSLSIYLNWEIVPAQTIQNNNNYISFQESLSGQSISKYAIFNGSTSQINVIHTENAPYMVTSAKMAKDSQKIHFVFSKLGLIDWSANRIMYKTDTNLSAPPEIVPFPYGTGFISNFNGLYFYNPDIALDSGNKLHVASLARTYSQGQIVSDQIMISKRSPNGWSNPSTLITLPSISPMRDISLSFDGRSNGHLFYVMFTNSSCIGAQCPRSIYELIFSSSTLNPISNTKIIDFRGPIPEVFSLKTLETQAGKYYGGLGFINYSSVQMPYSLHVGFSGPRSSGWTSQPLAFSLVSPQDHHATSLDLELDMEGYLQFVASEKNIQTGSKISVFTSTNKGISWVQSIILSSTLHQYRDVNILTKNRGKNKEINVAYTQSNFGSALNFDKLYFIKKPIRGTQTNTLIYQNPIGGNIVIGDLLS